MRLISLKYSIALGCLILMMPLVAQQHPFYSQYMVDKFLVNPSVAGANGITTVNFVSRQQYVGFENSPQTFALTAQSRLLDDSYILKNMRLKKKPKKKSRSGRVGLGASLYSDNNGIVSRTGFQGTYSYHLNIRNSWQVSGGLTVSGYQFRVNSSEVPIAREGDPLLSSNKQSIFVPDASIGFFGTNGSLYGGLAMTDLLGSTLRLGTDIYNDFTTYRQYNVLAGYKFPISNSIELEPSILLQGTRTNFLMDLNARMYYQELYWAGLSYRSNKAMIMMIGGRFDMFYFGYAFDLNMGLVQSYASGSHEVILGLRIGDNSTRRFRWFRQDQRNFDI